MNGRDILAQSKHLYLGLRGHVVCIRKNDGREVWRTKLPSSWSQTVTILVDEKSVFAAVRGHLHALDASTGSIRWSHHLDRLGSGIAILSDSTQAMTVSAVIAELEARASTAATGPVGAGV